MSFSVTALGCFERGGTETSLFWALILCHFAGKTSTTALSSSKLALEPLNPLKVEKKENMESRCQTRAWGYGFNARRLGCYRAKKVTSLPLFHTYFFFFVVLRLELRAFTLSHSTSPIFVKGFSR
jgi:hypothetical protein